MLEKLIVVRHGYFIRDGKSCPLSNEGKKQAQELRNKLKPLYGTSVILCSPSTRTRQYADILAEALEITPREERILYLGPDAAKPRHDQALELIRREAENANNVILVTHFEYTSELPPYFGLHQLQTKFIPYAPDYGEAVVVDCKKKSAEHIEL